jgi:hypothetical protein
MKYVIQLEVMLADVIFLLAIAVLLYYEGRHIFSWLIVGLVLNTWAKQGGFEAWKPSIIKKFLANAKANGL